MQTLTLEILRAYDPKGPRGSGSNQRWLCPLCQSREDSLSVNELEGVYHCWRGSCGARGRLGDAAHYDAREMERLRREREAEEAERKRRALCFPRLLGLRGTPGAKYLQGRGISLEAAQGARVAWCERFQGHPAVVFRIRDLCGRVVAYQGRYLHTDIQSEKCRSTANISRGVFVTAGAWDGDLVICEAPIDALSLAMMGRPAIALCGVNLPDWLPTAATGKRVWLAPDADAAGAKAAEVWERALRPYAAHVCTRMPRAGKDWNVWLQRKQNEALL